MPVLETREKKKITNIVQKPAKCLPNSLFTLGEPKIVPENSDIDGKVVGVKPFKVADVGVNAVKGVVLLVNKPVIEHKSQYHIKIIARRTEINIIILKVITKSFIQGKRKFSHS